MAGLFVATAIVIGLAVLVLASIGVWGCFMALSSRANARARLAHQARDAESQIIDIGRRAQEAIMTEALSRLRSRYNDPW